MDDEGDTLSLRPPPKKTSSFNLSSCFQSQSSADYQHFPSLSSPSAPQSPSHFLSPSSWFRSMSGVASPVRKGAGRRRRHSADFSYDPQSYSLNFDHGADDFRSPVAAAAVPRRRLRDLDLPPPVRSPLKDEAAPKTATSEDATTREMLF